jgi:hypothetical protein
LKTVGNGGNISSQYGYDIIFRDENGLAKLDHEIEDYNGSAGTLLAWVRIPTLHFNDSTNIYIYYGNSAVTSPTANPAGVWGSNYKGVWHLKETGSGAAGEYKDSTQYTNHGQGGGGTAGYVPSLWTGTKIIDGAQDFDGTDDYLDVGSGSSIDDIFASGGTVSAWIYPRGWGGNNVGRIAGKASDTSSNNGWSFLVNNSSCSGCLQLAKGFTTDEGYWNTPNSSISLNQWQHVVVSYDHSSAANDPTLYINGVAQAITETYTPSGTAESDAAQNMHIGNFTTIRAFNGAIDEVRIAAGVRDACWIGTEYNNQSSPTTYVTLTPEGGFAPTVVRLSSFKATRYPEGTLLEWRTGYEVDNLGFHIYREEKGQLVRLTPEPVAGSALLAGSRLALRAGWHYNWWDFPTLSPQSSSLSPVRYWLKDIDLNGKETMHGPVTPVFSREPLSKKFRPELLSELGMKLEERYHHYWKVRELKEKLALKRLEVRGAPRGRGLRSTPFEVKASNLKGRRPGPRGNSVPDPQTQQYLASRAAVKILVREEGWYQVSQPDLVAAGLSSRVDPRYLQLFVEGREQPMGVIGGKGGRFGPQDAIEFYGVGLDTPSTDTRVYWLVEGSNPGKRIHEFKGYSGSLGSLSLSSYPHTIEKKDRTVYFAALRNGDEGNFFGPLVYPAVEVDQLLEVRHLDPGASGDALLEVALQGVTTVAHSVKVLVNEVEVGEVVFEGQSRGFVSLPVSQSLLEEGENLVTLEARGGAMDASVIETIRLTYWHTYMADDNALKFMAQGGGHVGLSGFNNSNIRVIDITEPGELIEVIGQVVSQRGGYAISFRVPGTGQRTLLALTEERVKIPEGITSNHPSSWYQSRDGYDLVIISYRDFVGSLDPLRKLRESQRLRVALIDIEDLYDEFSFGVKSPKAMKDFLTYAKTKWQKPPRFVLLVGDASYDPRNYLGLGSFDLVPTKMVDTAYFETASDDWFVDLNNDGLPEMAVGRLPVQKAEEAAVIVSKIVGYEKIGATREALLVSDMKEWSDDFDFEKASEELRVLLPGSLTVRKIYRGEFSDDAQARAGLLNGIKQGPLLVNFIGHGSIEIWNGVLTSDDAESLINRGLPFFVGMSCLNGSFPDIYMDSLAESLMKAPQGGAVAVWMSSGLTEPGRQAVMNKELIKLLFNGQSLTLGEATARAKASVSDQDIRRTWILFGDPTTKLK